jgi:hypothetical protein
MKENQSHTAPANNVNYGTIQVDGLNIAYREAGDPAAPNSFCCTDGPLLRINFATSFL